MHAKHLEVFFLQPHNNTHSLGTEKNITCYDTHVGHLVKCCCFFYCFFFLLFLFFVCLFFVVFFFVCFFFVILLMLLFFPKIVIFCYNFVFCCFCFHECN